MLNSIDDLINLHQADGRIEEAYQRINFDNKTFIVNKYSLRIRRGNMSKEEARVWNLKINNEVKKNRILYKEVREFNSVFQLFNRLGIKSGKIEKYESPDFIYTSDEKRTGIEITKIYVGSDWVAEKISEEVKAIKKRKNELALYDEYMKFRGKIVSFQLREGILIMKSSEEACVDDYIVEIKNKIFEKIRKLIDDYAKFCKNIIFVEVVSSNFFTTKEDIQKLNEEMKYYISHLDGFYDNRAYELVLKTKTNWTKFDLKSGVFETI